MCLWRVRLCVSDGSDCASVPQASPVWCACCGNRIVFHSYHTSCCLACGISHVTVTSTSQSRVVVLVCLGTTNRITPACESSTLPFLSLSAIPLHIAVHLAQYASTSIDLALSQHSLTAALQNQTERTPTTFTQINKPQPPTWGTWRRPTRHQEHRKDTTTDSPQ